MTKQGKKKPPEKKRIAVEVDCDTERLYGPIPGAIKYLQEIANQFPGIDITLYENWTGYEDMSMIFLYSRLETDEEFNVRLEQEAYAAKLAAEKNQRDAVRREKEKQFEQLRRELGR